MLKGRARAVAIVLVLAVAGLVAFFGFGSSAPTGSAPGFNPTQAPTSVPTGGAPGVGPTLSQTPPPTRAPTGPPALVTVAGKIKQILANGDFVMNDGHLDYTIAMSPTPKIVNRTGVEVTKEFIQRDGTVQITGILSGSTISAQTVIIPTDKDKP